MRRLRDCRGRRWRRGARGLTQVDSTLVLTDLNPPGLRGPGLIREIHARHPAVPIIAMSAHGDDLLTAQALDAGASAYIPKRAMNGKLLDLLDRVSSIETRRRDESRVQAGLIETTERFQIDNDSSLVRPLVTGWWRQRGGCR